MSEPKLRIRLLFFATLRDMVGEKSIEFELPEGARVSDLKVNLAEQFPKLKPALESVLVSVNKEYAFDEEVIPPDAEIALFPPVSGGSDFPTVFAITNEELDLNELVKQITLPTTGAACVFTGMVRAVTKRAEPHDTNFLDYDAYIPMAESKMKQVADEIRSTWPSVEGIAIVQRIGRLYPGTPTVLVACTAGHRDTGVFEAARFGIDRLKQIVPIWKKEVSPAGEEWVEGGYIPQKGD
jgi:molybdopterin synthase catalytic subunit